MPLVKIDDKEITVERGINVIETARKAGIEIPHYCYHPALSRPANCRMCLVEVEGIRQLQTACTTTVPELPPERKVEGKYDLVVKNTTERVKKAREATLEFLLVHHPLDCPICDRAGECDLQDYTFRYGSGKSRYMEVKNVPPKKDVGSHVLLYSTRCVVCTRCVRFSQEITGTGELGLINRGSHDEIDIFPGKPLENKLSGNVVDICPVGALIDKEFLFKSRVWYLKKVNSICPGCSVGCNIGVDHRDGAIYRLKPRLNMEVNQHWICDDGRYGYKYVNSPDRLKSPMKRDGSGKLVPTSWGEALEILKQKIAEVSKTHGANAIGAFGSAQCTNEENFLLAKLMKESVKSNKLFLFRKETADQEVRYPKFVIEADKNPNTKGAAQMLTFAAGVDEVNGSRNVVSVPQAWEKLDGSNLNLKLLYFLCNAPEVKLSENAKSALKQVDFIVVHDIFLSEVAQLAHLVFPGATFAEKDGTFTNSKGRVQRINKALEAPGVAKADWEILVQVSNRLSDGAGFKYYHPAEILAEIGNSIPAYKDLSYQKIGEQGVTIE